MLARRFLARVAFLDAAAAQQRYVGRAIVTLETETAAFLTMRTELPSLAVLRVSREALVDYAREHSALDVPLDVHVQRFSCEPSDRPDRRALLARVFLDLWVCSNLSPEVWDALIALDPTTAPLAVECAYYVLFYSGADCGSVLRAILSKHNCQGALEQSPLTTTSPHAREWLASQRTAME